MPGGEHDRPISASEVERWSYCPLSWFLERMDSEEDEALLEKGKRNHIEEGEKLASIKVMETGSRESKRITFAYLTFAVVILSMSLLMLLLTNTGFLEEDVWQAAVLVISAALVLISVAFYLSRSPGRGGGFRRLLLGFSGRMRKNRSIGGYLPLLSYVFGMILLVNGIILLRPFGIPDDTVTSAFTLSLLFLYVLLFVSLVYYFRTTRTREGRRDIRLGMPLLLMLLVSISVLFLIASEQLHSEIMMGWIFLGLSFLWFIWALVFDLIRSLRMRRSNRKADREDLPLATIALAASVFTVMAFLARGDNLENYHTLSVIMAGLWLTGAVGFFIKGTADRIKADHSKEDAELPKGSSIFSVDDLGDPDGRGKPMVSGRHYLVGSPDLIIEEEGMKIPVEMKTGRVPEKPYFSHIMQLAAYLVLVDVKFEQRTPYGYIDYVSSESGRKRHRIEWDMMTKALVLSKVSEIRDAERMGEAHRNHQRVGKCRHCSRRNGCPERLA